MEIPPGEKPKCLDFQQDTPRTTLLQSEATPGQHTICHHTLGLNILVLGVITMKLMFQKIDTLPRLAWCAKIDKLNHTIRILHGPYVEVSNEFFCEGAWSGDFTAGDFEKNLFMGSGERSWVVVC